MTSKDLFLQLSYAAGYCCPYALLRANQKIRGSILAKKLGIEPRTLRYWRRSYKMGKITRCPKCPRLAGFHRSLVPPPGDA